MLSLIVGCVNIPENNYCELDSLIIFDENTMKVMDRKEKEDWLKHNEKYEGICLNGV